MTFSVFVPGVPAPQGSKRHVGKGVMVESSPRVKSWRLDVIEKCAEQNTPPFTRPVHVDLVFCLPRPRGHFGTGKNAQRVRASAPEHPGGKPDIDKLVRAVFDALTIARVVLDDSLVVQMEASKVYAARTESPGVSIVVKPL